MRDQGIGRRPPGWDRERAREILLSAAGFMIVVLAVCGLVAGIVACDKYFSARDCPPTCTYPGGPGFGVSSTPVPRATG